MVLHCKTGVRSAEALAVLKGAGYSDAVHVGGGVVGVGEPDRPVAAVVLTLGEAFRPSDCGMVRNDYPGVTRADQWR